jgi:hypothetical protein
MRKYLRLFLIMGLLIGLTPVPISAFAQETLSVPQGTLSVQTNILQKTVKSIEDLINAKDEDAESLTFRIQALKQVIELSISEAKELKVKILTLEDVKRPLDKLNEKELAWRQNQIEKLNAAIEYYENRRKLLTEQDPITLEWIKSEAQIFKEWRENNFLPLADSIIDFLLIQQEQRAIKTTQERLKKITRDLQSLEKKGVRNLKPLFNLLTKAETAINESVELNKQAVVLFWDKQNLGITTSTATSTEPIEPIPPPLVRDLVRDSLNKIREAYQIFIEMSSLVRKLFILR